MLKQLYDERAITVQRGNITNISDEAYGHLEDFAKMVVDNVNVIKPPNEDLQALKKMIGTRAWYTPPEYREMQNFRELSQYIKTTSQMRDPRTEKLRPQIQDLLSHVEDRFPSVMKGAIHPSDRFEKVASFVESASARSRPESIRSYDARGAADLVDELTLALGSAYTRSIRQSYRRKK